MAGAVKLAIILTTTMKGAQAYDKAGRGLRGLGAAAKAVVPMLKLFAAYAAFEFMKDSIKIAKEFEQVMAEAGSIIGATSSEIKEFSDAIREMSMEIPKSPQDLGLALYDIFSAGITDVDKALGALRLSAQAASAGLTETATAAKAGIATMNAFGMEAEDLNHIFDVQFLTIRYGILRYGELAEVIGQVAPSAKAAGQSMEGMFATMAILTKKGLNARVAATSLARAMDSITKPEAIRAAAEMGVSFLEMSDDARRASAEYVNQKRALDDLTTSYDKTQVAVKSLGEEMDKVTLEEAKNRLEISKIRRAAEKEGRDMTKLTAEETKRIGELESANADLSIQYSELSVAQMETRVQATEINNALEEQTLRSEEAKKAFDEQIEISGNFRPLVDIVKELNDKYGDLGEAAKADIISQLFPQIRARRAIMSIMGSEEELMAMTDEMMNQSGAMAEAYAINTDTAAAGFQLMENQMTDMKIEMGNALIPVLQEFIPILREHIIPLIKDSFIPLFQSMMPLFKAVAKVIGIVAGIFHEYPELLYAIVGGLVAFKIAVLASSLAMAASPMGMVALAIAGLVMGLIILVKHWDEITAALAPVAEAFKGFVDGVLGVLQPLWDFIQKIIDGVKWVGEQAGKVVGVGKGIVKGAGGVLSGIGGMIGLQEGGIVTEPGLYPLAERGIPEAVIPLDGGAVPVRITGGAVPGRGVTESHDVYNITVQTGVLPVQETPESIVKKMVSALVEEKMRGKARVVG